jgi:hypothetical protein
MKKLSFYTDLRELETSLLLRGIQIAKISKLGWLIGLAKHAIWADSLLRIFLSLLSERAPNNNKAVTVKQ